MGRGRTLVVGGDIGRGVPPPSEVPLNVPAGLVESGTEGPEPPQWVSSEDPDLPGQLEVASVEVVSEVGEELAGHDVGDVGGSPEDGVGSSIGNGVTGRRDPESPISDWSGALTADPPTVGRRHSVLLLELRSEGI